MNTLSDLDRPTLLVVDDVPQNVEIIAEYLSEDYDCQCAFSGDEALALLAPADLPLPDLILLDVMMPGMDGYAVCRALKAEARIRGIPVIFVTAKQDTESEVAALAAGGVDFIHKPIVPETLRARVGLHLALRRRELELQRLNEELAAATASKSLFLASMSHEIRTPMNVVLGLAQLLEREPLGEEPLEMVRRIRAAGDSLLGIINDILDFSKIEAGQFELEHRVFGLEESLRHIGNLLEETARGKGLRLLLEAPPLPGWLAGDPLRLEQVLINLTSNAIKFTERGEVTLRARSLTCDASTVRLRFEVSDTGIGLSPAACARLFQPYTQAETGTARRFGGTGLGLSISKRLVELMGGAIGVESREGVGSTFWFELAFERREDAPPDSAVETFRVAGPRLRGLRVLVADDNPVNLYLAEHVLRKEGAEVTQAQDGRQVLDLLQARPGAYDLVLMDIQMPVMDGLEATRMIRRELQLTTLPVIALSAGVMAAERQQALEAGVDDFLPKPMNLDRMAEMILKYCSAEREITQVGLSVPEARS